MVNNAFESPFHRRIYDHVWLVFALVVPLSLLAIVLGYFGIGGNPAVVVGGGASVYGCALLVFGAAYYWTTDDPTGVPNIRFGSGFLFLASGALVLTGTGPAILQTLVLVGAVLVGGATVVFIVGGTIY